MRKQVRGPGSPGLNLPKLYRELASWWPLVSAPEGYAEDAELYRRVLAEACEKAPRSLLELGSGGGNNASHLKGHFQITLVDLSPDMLSVSQALNPECEHIEGDMRTVRLERSFDAVLVHDAVAYMCTESALRETMETASWHLKPGGAALFAPDWTRESFQATTSSGGGDGEARALRYLEWTHHRALDGTYTVDMVFVLREGNHPVRIVHDQHRCGLFSRELWLRLLKVSGFDARSLRFHQIANEPGGEGFLARKPACA